MVARIHDHEPTEEGPDGRKKMLKAKRISPSIRITGYSALLVRPSIERGTPCGIKEFNEVRDNHGMPRLCSSTNTGTRLHSVFLS